MAKKATFKQSMQRLDEIIAALDQNTVELEEAMHLFEEGLHLVKDCDAQLKTFENEMNILIAQENEEEATDGEI